MHRTHPPSSLRKEAYGPDVQDGYVDDNERHTPPDDSGSEENHDDSDSTLEDIDTYTGRFGHPLQRMAREENSDADNTDTLLYWTLSNSSSSSASSVTSSVVYDIDYEGLIDEFLDQRPLLRDKMDFVEPLTIGPTSAFSPASASTSLDLVIKCLSSISRELYILLELNHPDLRQDPWNPCPHVLSAVEKGDRVYLCMEQLSPYDVPPFRTVANYTDFLRQVLEGLTFLHELSIAGVSFSDLSCIMVDLRSASSTVKLPMEFDRTVYPVKYYFTNLSKASKVESRHHHSSSEVSPFIKDVQNCGMFFESMLIRVPPLASRYRSLMKAMTGGGFGADDARKLFEARTSSLESSVFDMPVPVLPREERPRQGSMLVLPTSSPPLRYRSSST